MKKKSLLAAWAAILLLAAGCSEKQPAAQSPNAQTAPGQPSAAPDASASPSAGQAPAAKGEIGAAQPGTTAGKAQTVPANGQTAPVQAGPIDLTPELTVNPTLVIGKTTYAELSKKYGAPISSKRVKTAFRKGLASGSGPFPQIEETVALFKLNPLSGKPLDTGFPLYFTADDKQVLVSAPVFLRRGGLLEKIKNGTLSFDDVKRVYGEPTRESKDGLEYYDFDHKAVMFVFKNSKGHLNAVVTKYDLLYAGDPADLQAHEQTIRRLSQQQKT